MKCTRCGNSATHFKKYNSYDEDGKRYYNAMLCMSCAREVVKKLVDRCLLEGAQDGTYKMEIGVDGKPVFSASEDAVKKLLRKK